MTLNNRQNSQSFALEFRGELQSVFQHEAYFQDFFHYENVDGVTHNQVMFSIKTQDIPVAITQYDTDNVLNTVSRFGEVTEIIYEDTNAPFRDTWSINEGIDMFTVNNGFATALTGRLQAQARALVSKFNNEHSKFISESASKTVTLPDLTEESLTSLFNDLADTFTQNKVDVNRMRVAKITQKIMNALVDSKLVTAAKNSIVNVDFNTLPNFKGFALQVVPDEYFHNNDCIYAYVTQVGVFATGITLGRTKESENFAGTLIQNAGKYGEFILEDNKKAVVAVNM